MISPTLFFFIKIALTVQGFLWFHINFRTICSNSVEGVMGILIDIKSIDCFGSMDSLTILTLPIHKHRISFHFLVFSSIPSSVFYNLQSIGLFTSLSKVHKYFIFFNTILNRFVFFISLSATLLNSFISSKSFLVETLCFSIYSIMAYENSDSFTSLPIWIPLFLISCLIAWLTSQQYVKQKWQEWASLLWS